MSEDQKQIRVHEIGIGGFDFSGDYVQTDFLPQLQWPRAGRVFREMSDNDPTIGAILYMSKQLVRKAGWKVEASGSSDRDKEAADFLQSCMNDMDHSWNEFVGEVLTMMVYGFSFHEVVYKVRKGPNKDPRFKSKFNDGRIGWRKFASRSQRTCEGWIINQETGEILALKQQAAPDYRERIIPVDKALHFKVDNDFGNPYGKSLLRNTYRPWFFKKRIEEIEGIGIERDLAGLPVLIPPVGVDVWNTEDPELVRLRQESESLVRSIRRDKSEGVVIPNGWELKLLSTGSQRQFDTNQILNRYDQRIAITLLADIVMLGADKVGSFALADVKKSLLSASLETLIECISDTINRQEVPRLMELNGFTDLTVLPRIAADEVETPSTEQIAILLKAMRVAGIDTQDPKIDEFIRKVASLPTNDPDVLELKKQIYAKSLEEQLNPPEVIPPEDPPVEEVKDE